MKLKKSSTLVGIANISNIRCDGLVMVLKKTPGSHLRTSPTSMNLFLPTIPFIRVVLLLLCGMLVVGDDDAERGGNVTDFPFFTHYTRASLVTSFFYRVQLILSLIHCC